MAFDEQAATRGQSPKRATRHWGRRTWMRGTTDRMDLTSIVMTMRIGESVLAARFACGELRAPGEETLRTSLLRLVVSLQGQRYP
jgi:hypothetical protein